jgi:L-alanine-DL-glutamate epimerase-like enolase superfamily enzyme
VRLAERTEAAVDRIAVSAYKIPTEEPESDGTLAWDATTLVVVEVSGGGATGLGYTYADEAAASVVREKLCDVVRHADVFESAQIWAKMVGAIRNLGRGGIASMAIAAVDNALWDLRARILERPLWAVLGAMRTRVPVYGSGGFTSYTIPELQRQLGGWVRDGIPRVKMKVGREPECDVERVRAARKAIGSDAELYVDANGAYTAKEALEFAKAFAECGVTWFEEPVYHRDLAGLRYVRERAPAPMEISAGEYGYCPQDFEVLLEGGAVDVLQADVTRCEGTTGFARVDALCEARNVPLSTHCAPALSAQPAAAAKRIRHLEYFHDHVRIERMLFEGFPELVDGAFDVSLCDNGNGLTFKRNDAERYAL